MAAAASLIGSVSRLLLCSTLAVGVVIFTLPFLDGPSLIFGFMSLSASEIGAVIMIVAGYVATTELAKARFFAPAGS